MGAYSQQVPAGQNQYSYAPPQDVPPAHAQQQPAYTVGALTQQNVTAQYGHRGVRGRAPESMHLQSLTSSASSAGYGEQGQLRRQLHHASNQYGPPALAQHSHAPQYGLPRQPEGANHVTPSQDPRYMMQQPVQQQHHQQAPRIVQKPGFTKHTGKPPPAQPRHAFQQVYMSACRSDRP